MKTPSILSIGDVAFPLRKICITIKTIGLKFKISAIHKRISNILIGMVSTVQYTEIEGQFSDGQERQNQSTTPDLTVP